MAKTLVVVGHNDIEKSTYNKRLVESIKSLPDITIHVLKNNHPFNVAKEQQLIKDHKNIVLQFPLYWYSVTPVLKAWLDEVFLYGFAYGEGGDHLVDKKVLFATTTYGAQEAYKPDGHNRHYLKDLLTPLYQTFNFTRSKTLDPFVVHGCGPNAITEADLVKKLEEYKKLVASL